MNNNTIPDPRKFKTAADFLDWLDRRKAAKKLADEQAARLAKMQWADDGGRPSETTPKPAPSPAGD